MVEKVVKWGFDIFLAIFLLIVLSPLLGVLMVIQFIVLGRPIFFSQERPGKFGVPFKLYKFRTMRESRDKKGNLLADEVRLTGWGKFLRSTSLDELPELINIIKGEMSFVGPRPLLMSYMPLYNERQRRRHEVLPGITGWAQINGRNTISWEQKFELDVWYVENQNFWLDIKIIFLTFFKVIRREGISSKNHATMPEFTGAKADYGNDKEKSVK